MKTELTDIYSEELKYRQPAAWILITVISGLVWYAFIEQIVLSQPFGSNPAPDILLWIFFVIIGLGFPWLFIVMGLQVRLKRDRLVIRFFPFYKKEILLNDIFSFKVRTFRPVMEFGGWGIRYDFQKTTAFIVSGNKAIEITTKQGRIYLINSQDCRKFETSLMALIPDKKINI